MKNLIYLLLIIALMVAGSALLPTKALSAER
jgi:hypothetical protein